MKTGQEIGSATAKAARGKSPPPSARTLSHNLNGQRLGRKGRDTRERIIAAAQTLLAAPEPVQITLSAVAREASLGMTTLYLYFGDLTELLLAVLEPMMATAEDCYLASLRIRWPEETLGQHCIDFVNAYHAFWQQHSRILHLRNSMADQQDQRMMVHRIRSAQPLIAALVEQMDCDPRANPSPAFGMASVLVTGLERLVTIATDAYLPELLDSEFAPNMLDRLGSEARLLELGIRDCRTSCKDRTTAAA